MPTSQICIVLSENFFSAMNVLDTMLKREKKQGTKSYPFLERFTLKYLLF